MFSPRRLFFPAILLLAVVPSFAQSLTRERYEFARIQREFAEALGKWRQAALEQMRTDRLATPTIRLTTTDGTADRELFPALDEYVGKYLAIVNARLRGRGDPSRRVETDRRTARAR
ncbi:MAG: hypothetical protein HY720_15060 [Planctomycetes bacterium]|nr:hypothetical protein [Planctomycetota bacterium]